MLLPRPFLNAAFLAVTAVLARPADSFASKARANSLLDHHAFTDDTDLFMFPSSLPLFPNQILVDFGLSSFSGSGGAIYSKTYGVGVFLNRAQVARGRLGVSDEVSGAMSALRQIREAETSAPTTSTQPELTVRAPDKIVDLFVSGPERAGSGRFGIGLSFSHDSSGGQVIPTSVSDETGLPQSVTTVQNARSTLFAFVPSYTRRTDRGGIEISADLAIALFELERRLVSTRPENVPSDNLLPVDGTLIRQTGPPSIGAAVRYQTIGDDTQVDWVVLADVDRRDYDTVNVTTTPYSKVNADRTAFGLEAGPRWKLAENVVFSTLVQTGVDRLTVKPRPGPSQSKTDFVIPGVIAGLEARLGRYVIARGAARNVFGWTKSKRPPVAPDGSSLRFSSSTQYFQWALGLGTHVAGLQIDASIEPELITHGPALLGGDTSDGRGTGLFSLLSLTYRFGEPAKLSGASESDADAAPSTQP